MSVGSRRPRWKSHRLPLSPAQLAKFAVQKIRELPPIAFLPPKENDDASVSSTDVAGSRTVVDADAKQSALDVRPAKGAAPVTQSNDDADDGVDDGSNGVRDAAGASELEEEEEDTSVRAQVLRRRTANGGAPVSPTSSIRSSQRKSVVIKVSPQVHIGRGGCGKKKCRPTVRCRNHHAGALHAGALHPCAHRRPSRASSSRTS